MSNGKEVISHPEFQKAFDRIESDLIKAAKSIGMSDHEGHQAIILSLQMLNRIEKHFKSLLNDEKIKEFKARA